MTTKQKLELTWIGKEHRPRLETRILLEDREQSYHAKHRANDPDILHTRLTGGATPLALQALDAELHGTTYCPAPRPPAPTARRAACCS